MDKILVGMERFSSTRAKQAFGQLLEAAARSPVAIERHKKVKAIVAAPEFFSRASRDEIQLSERRAARAAQTLLEKERLIKHQRIAIGLLTLPKKEQEKLVRHAQGVVTRWRVEGLCSQDYIDRWTRLLDMPVRDMAIAMTSDLDGWGTALRQNSPWTAV